MLSCLVPLVLVLITFGKIRCLPTVSNATTAPTLATNFTTVPSADRRIEVDDLTAKQMEHFSNQMDEHGQTVVVQDNRPTLSTIAPLSNDHPDSLDYDKFFDTNTITDANGLPYGYEDVSPDSRPSAHELKDFLLKIDQGQRSFKTRLIKNQLYKCVLVPEAAKESDVLHYMAHHKMKKAKFEEQSKFVYHEKKGDPKFHLFRIDINRVKPKEENAVLQDDHEVSLKTETSTPRSMARKMNRVGQLKTIFRSLKDNLLQLMCPTPEDCFDDGERNQENIDNTREHREPPLGKLLHRIKMSQDESTNSSEEEDDHEQVESNFLEDYVRYTKGKALF